MNPTLPQRILLGVTAGISAYKTADLIRLLREQGAEVRVVMTESAKAFITPVTLQALSGHPVYDSLWQGSNSGMPHIELAKWAECIVIAPATADYMARLAHGNADDLLSTICLASESPLFVAPAMNQAMWQHPATQHNQQILEARGVILLGPDSGSQACGDFGPGRMLEPEKILGLLQVHFDQKTCLKNLSIVITAGPTQEAIDPVRFLSNKSSGKMGYALAQVASQWGACVTLISGPVSLACPPGVKRMDVLSAEEMQEAVMSVIQGADIFISAAAVADYRMENIARQKLKKEDSLTLTFIKNPDILYNVSRLESRPFLVGFALETQNMLENAGQKLDKCDLLVANTPNALDQDHNEACLLTQTETSQLPMMSKIALAGEILKYVIDMRGKKPI